MSVAEVKKDMTSGSNKKEKLTISITKPSAGNQLGGEEEKNENSLGSMNNELEEGEVEKKKKKPKGKKKAVKNESA